MGAKIRDDSLKAQKAELMYVIKYTMAKTLGQPIGASLVCIRVEVMPGNPFIICHALPAANHSHLHQISVSDSNPKAKGTSAQCIL